MSACTFFGHSSCYRLQEETVMEAIRKLIDDGVNTFYVGNHGAFDSMVHSCLKKLAGQYPHIRYGVVLAYLPVEKREYENHSDTLYPEGLEVGPPRFAIERRNRWMLQQSQYCLCYIDHTWGGAYKFASMAKHRGMTVVNLGSVNL